MTLFLFVQWYVLPFLNWIKGSSMVLTYGTVEGMDLQVSKGLAVGYFGIDDDLAKIPKVVGDWALRTVPDSFRHGVGVIVAVPTNRRTRRLYNKGRIVWLMALGFTEAQAWQYFKVSKTNKRKWDHRVATFVLTHYQLDSFILEAIINNESPRNECIKQGIYTTMHHGQVLGACKLLLAIQSL